MASNKQRQKAAYRQTCQKLTGEHRDVMKAMEAYIKNSELKKEEVFSICRKLAEKLYRAQRQGQTVEQALGKDLIGVCDVYIHLGAKKTAAERRIESLEGCLIGLLALVLIELFYTGTAQGLLDFAIKMPITQGFIISSVLILGFAWALSRMLNQHTFGFSEKKQRLRSVGAIVLFTVIWVASLFAKWALRKHVLCWVNAWIPIAAIAVLYLIALAIKRKTA